MFRPAFLALGLLVALGTGASYAQTQEQQNACYNDAQRLCANAIPDRDKVYRCLSSNRGRLSAMCRGAIAPAKKATSSRKTRRHRR